MHKKVIVAVMIGGLVVASGIMAQGQGQNKGKGNTVTICHSEQGKASVTLEVPESAVPGHLKHGDTMGACGASPAG